MKSIVVKNRYGLDNVTIEEQVIPTIRANEVLVKVQAVSFNQLDLMIVKGAFGTSLPHTLGSDAAGIVEEIGTAVTNFQVGDVVATHFIQDWQSGDLKSEDLASRLGTSVKEVFSEYIALPESSLVKIPKNLSPAEASTLPIAGLTAWEAIVNLGKLKAGQTVLLQGTGGVSIFALQFAKALGAKVIITSSSNDKLEMAKKLGADEVINYAEIADWQMKVLEFTEGKGVDLALEMSWADMGKTIEGMKLGGKIVVIGLLGGANANLSVFGILQKALSVLGSQVGSKSSFEVMNKAIEVNNIKPVVDKEFTINQLSEALAYFEEGKHFGKVVLEF
ncbi:NADPH:quinone reductase-like Zn-dependent oxidoreductase [Algoriphagus sp. 4150]|uniref:zinc-dependent alcohol dehydrogenase family protein n=1 Tax=Algoriphagus sp. 4150 TaxID=2817756 RepID=UPI002854FCC7|nr:NAD(P)-dependent alcohol dehydrogenase [Algoriphagus sp. 4150]MDR7132020.1 NADPH:quinone reductase-like Zn-dependent oxidoreductase [Algoriphagus sp. 4150]